MRNKFIFNILILLSFMLFCNSLCIAKSEDLTEEDIQKAQAAYKQGVEFVHSKAYDSALDSFQRALSYNPKMTDAYYNIASIYIYQKRYNDAYSAYVKLLAINPKDYDAILQAAKLSYNRKDYALVMKYLKYIPEDYEKYYLARQLYYDAKEQFDEQKNRIERAKISTATKNKQILIDNFASPAGVVVDSDGSMYVACYGDNAIVKVDNNNKKVNFVKDYLLEGPVGLAIDNYDNIYVANFDGDNILKITKGGNVSVFMSNVSKPYILYIKDDILYVSEQGNNAVIKYNLSSH